jgi:hypothetical protein
VPHLIAIPTELATDSRHIPCNGCERRKKIESEFDTDRVENRVCEVPSTESVALAQGSRDLMDAYEVELRGRLTRASDQIQAQHRRLEPLFEDLKRDLARGTGRDAQTAAFRLDGAIRAHFLLEERIIFPAIHELCSQNDTELEALVRDHRGLGMALQSVIDEILEEQFDLATQSLEKCWLAVKDHETREEAFLNTLDSAPSERNL